MLSDVPDYRYLSNLVFLFIYFIIFFDSFDALRLGWFVPLSLSRALPERVSVFYHAQIYQRNGKNKEKKKSTQPSDKYEKCIQFFRRFVSTEKYRENFLK